MPEYRVVVADPDVAILTWALGLWGEQPNPPASEAEVVQRVVDERLALWRRQFDSEARAATNAAFEALDPQVRRVAVAAAKKLQEFPPDQQVELLNRLLAAQPRAPAPA